MRVFPRPDGVRCALSPPPSVSAARALAAASLASVFALGLGLGSFAAWEHDAVLVLTLLVVLGLWATAGLGLVIAQVLAGRTATAVDLGPHAITWTTGSGRTRWSVHDAQAFRVTRDVGGSLLVAVRLDGGVQVVGVREPAQARWLATVLTDWRAPRATLPDPEDHARLDRLRSADAARIGRADRERTG